MTEPREYPAGADATYAALKREAAAEYPRAALRAVREARVAVGHAINSRATLDALRAMPEADRAELARWLWSEGDRGWPTTAFGKVAEVEREFGGSDAR